MAVEEYFTLARDPESELYHWMHFSVIPKTLFLGWSYSFTKDAVGIY